jgi:DNA-directed RNA polymerase specialized sigma24 family protein
VDRRLKGGYLVVLREELPNLSSAADSAWRWLRDNPVGRKPEVILPKRKLQVQRRLSGDEEQLVVEAYLAGLTVYEVGAQFRIHRTTVSAIMERHGVKMRRAPKRPYRRRSS